ncbi:putative reverse transcriptase domain-containing protein [Tanacetum coccineum]
MLRGKANVVADTLSRKTRHDSLLVKSLQMVITLDFYEYIKTAQHEAWENGDVNSKRLVGATKMYYNLKPDYWWPGMKRDIVNLLRFLCGNGKRPLWDRLTKSAIFLPIKESMSSEALAELYLREVVARHGVGDRVMLKVSPWKGVIRFRKRGKLGPRYMGPFRRTYRVGKVAYKLELPEELNSIHNTFHVSQLHKCLVDEAEYAPLADIVVEEKLDYVEEPVEILDTMVKKLKGKEILFLKVRWKHRKGLDYTWEPEEELIKYYPAFHQEWFVRTQIK